MTHPSGRSLLGCYACHFGSVRPLCGSCELYPEVHSSLERQLGLGRVNFQRVFGQHCQEASQRL